MIIPILISAFIGTLVMTAYSYAVSRVRNEQYREPELLANLIMKLMPFSLDKKWDYLIGSIAHYLAGLVFMLCYILIWNNTPFVPSIIFGIVAGFCSGIVGVIVWMITFNAHPNPPNIPFWGYYGQLVIAHIFFGVGATGTYILFYA